MTAAPATACRMHGVNGETRTGSSCRAQVFKKAVRSNGFAEKMKLEMKLADLELEKDKAIDAEDFDKEDELEVLVLNSI